LAGAGIPFQVVPSTGQESLDYQEPLLAAEGNARVKAEGAAVPSAAPRPHFILGADTIVVVDGGVLGKPGDRAEARRMLALLSGRSHLVITGVALMREDVSGERRCVVGSAETEVWFRALRPVQLDAYLDGGEWADKAGAYGIQGAAGLFVERIEGEYANVVGLPLSLMVMLCARLGFDLLGRRWIPSVGTSRAHPV